LKDKTMQTRQLGNSDMQLTPIGFGAWALGGGGWAAGWGPQDDQDSVSAIHEALDRGINWIDTAAVYGLGHSEDVVAQALKGHASRPYIFTKCERVWNENGQISGSLKADSIRRECEDSLRRLGVDVIDLYQIHWPEPDADIEEGWTALAQLQQEGKVRWIGVSNFNVNQMSRAQKIAPVTSNQPPYSLVNPAVEDEILPYCLEQNIGVINYSPMGAGLLTGTMTRERIANLPADDWRSRSDNFREPRLSRHLALVEILQAIAEKHGRTPGEVSIAWTLHNPAVSAAIVGARNAGQIDGIIGAMDFRLSEDEFEQIEQFRRENP
jgi:aryl-alcohol dehydrogenase-like predicted oxidoreductase